MTKVLDAGCGLGRYIYNQSVRHTGEYYGVDITPSNIESAKQSYPEINFQVMSVQELNFPDRSFDVVISRDVLEHVDDPEKTVHEMARVLKSGGKLVIKIPAGVSERWLLNIRPDYFKEIHHLRIFEEDAIEKMVLPLGFKMEVKEPQAFFDHFFLYFMFKYSEVSENQVALGSWKNHWWGPIVAPIHAFLKPELVFDTWLKYIPIWIITLPVGYTVNYVGNKFMPKSWYYEFIKM